MAAVDLTPERIVELFLEVDAELYALTDRHHDVMIAGGAAVALLWDEQRITNDVDVVSEGMTPQLRTAASRVAPGLWPGTGLVQRRCEVEGAVS